MALARTAGDPSLTRVLHPIVLRAMRQARYGGENRWHFALAFDAYLHFTSPIRRYPDLVVHRALKAHLQGTLAGWFPIADRLPEMGEHTSTTERRK